MFSYLMVIYCTQVFVGLFPYEEAADICGGRLPDYIPKVKTYP